jgi:two-component system sensor histidine kinase RegB
VVIGTAFLMFYAWRVAEEARGMSDALSATQMALSRERELSSLGGLAAATAHELGTPLSTIALVGKELLRTVGLDRAAREDLQLLNSEVTRCREILARLSHNPSAGIDRNVENMRFDAMLAHIGEIYRQENITIAAVQGADMANQDEPAPVVQRSPEIIQGLGNLIENATEFARREVLLEMYWSAQILRLSIIDDGPGFPNVVLGAIGDPYISTRPDRGRMGLGLFISKTLLERTGADIRFANRQGTDGAIVVITWPRGVIELQDEKRD